MLSASAKPAADELWEVVFGQSQIAPARLANAIERAALEPPLDFRTRLLIRDSLVALRTCWSGTTFEAWICRSPGREVFHDIESADLGQPGFTTLSQRLMEPIKRETVLQFLRDLGTSVSQPAEVYIGGASALILLERLERHTDDIDVVDEIPETVRSDPAVLDELARRYGLRLAHFQSHFLPEGWRDRAQSLGRLGRLDVRLVDPLDIFIGKLTSARSKDRDDLRVLARTLDREQIKARLSSAAKLLAEPRLRDNASKNWYVLFGDELPA